MRLIGLKEVQALLGCSEKAATRILKTEGCPTLKRTKNQSYKIFDEDLIDWIKEGRIPIMKKYRWNAKKCIKNLSLGFLKVVGVFAMLCFLGMESIL